MPSNVGSTESKDRGAHRLGLWGTDSINLLRSQRRISLQKENLHAGKFKKTSQPGFSISSPPHAAAEGTVRDG
jgi:hypothetical protein